MRRPMMAADLMRRERERLVQGQARAEDRALLARLDETVALATGRGEASVRAGRRVRIVSRDGLLHLLESGVIDRGQWEAGSLYRRAYEAMDVGLKSTLSPDFGIGRGPETLAWAERRAHLAGRLTEMEALAANGRQLWALRLCAGQGRTVRNISGGGRNYAATIGALRAVLSAIAGRYGLAVRS